MKGEGLHAIGRVLGRFLAVHARCSAIKASARRRLTL